MLESLNMPVHIVGVGGVGSHVAYYLSKRKDRPRIVHVWDGDTVSYENCLGQAYDHGHVGMKKVHAIADLMQAWGSQEPIQHDSYVSIGDELSGVVFLCVDKMSTRKNLWENCIRRVAGVMFMVEVRVQALNALIHIVDPHNERHVRKWEQYWYPDSEATNGPSCGTETAVGPICDLAANLGVWSLIRFSMSREWKSIENQLRVSVHPFKIESFTW